MVIRPLFFEFPGDANLLSNDKQFFLWDSLLFSPVLTQGATSVTAYLPAGRWYDFYTHEPLGFPQGMSVLLPAPLEKIPIHIRGGKIVPTQTPAYTTYETSVSDYILLVALDGAGFASGKLYLDDGISLGVGATNSSIIDFAASTSNNVGKLVSQLLFKLEWVLNGINPHSVPDEIIDLLWALQLYCREQNCGD